MENQEQRDIQIPNEVPNQEVLTKTLLDKKGLFTWFVSVLLIAVILGGYIVFIKNTGISSTNGETGELKDWNTYTNTEWDYSIKYPKETNGEEWVYEESEDKQSVYFGPASSKQGGYKWGVEVYKDVQTDALVGQIGNQFSDRKVERKEVVVNNNMALLVTVTTDQYSDWISKNVLISNKDITYKISNGAVEDPLFDKFINTFNIHGDSTNKTGALLSPDTQCSEETISKIQREGLTLSKENTNGVIDWKNGKGTLQLRSVETEGYNEAYDKEEYEILSGPRGRFVYCMDNPNKGNQDVVAILKMNKSLMIVPFNIKDGSEYYTKMEYDDYPLGVYTGYPSTMHFTHPIFNNWNENVMIQDVTQEGRTLLVEAYDSDSNQTINRAYYLGYYWSASDKFVELEEGLNTYTNSNLGFEFQYPTQFGEIKVDSKRKEVIGEEIQVTVPIGEEGTVRIIVEDIQSGFCFLGFCNTSPINPSIKHNNVNWASLSYQTVCDLGGCLEFDLVLRTTHNNKRYYITIQNTQDRSEEEIADIVYQTFKFID